MKKFTNVDMWATEDMELFDAEALIMRGAVAKIKDTLVCKYGYKPSNFGWKILIREFEMEDLILNKFTAEFQIENKTKTETVLSDWFIYHNGSIA